MDIFRKFNSENMFVRYASLSNHFGSVSLEANACFFSFKISTSARMPNILWITFPWDSHFERRGEEEQGKEGEGEEENI